MERGREKEELLIKRLRNINNSKRDQTSSTASYHAHLHSFQFSVHRRLSVHRRYRIQDPRSKIAAQQLLCSVSHTLVGWCACTRSSFILSRESRTLGTGFKESNHEWARHSSPPWSKVPLDHQWPYNHCFWVKKKTRKKPKGVKTSNFQFVGQRLHVKSSASWIAYPSYTRGGFTLGM